MGLQMISTSTGAALRQASAQSCHHPPLAAAPRARQRVRQPRCSSQLQPRDNCYNTHECLVDLTRRQALLGGLLLASSAVSSVTPASSLASAQPVEDAPSDGRTGEDLVAFSNPSEGYSLLCPKSWEQVDKPGAASLFRDPAKKSTNVGVTVLPVMIASLEQFGDLQLVGERLLNAERAKESTLSVSMVTQSTRSSGGAATYDFEYELESTRGRKRILSTVTISGRKLYIANGNITCSKESCANVEQQLPLLRRVTQSLTVGDNGR